MSLPFFPFICCYELLNSLFPPMIHNSFCEVEDLILESVDNFRRSVITLRLLAKFCVVSAKSVHNFQLNSSRLKDWNVKLSVTLIYLHSLSCFLPQMISNWNIRITVYVPLHCLKMNLSLNVVDLQCCVSFCYTAKWIHSLFCLLFLNCNWFQFL